MFRMPPLILASLWWVVSLGPARGDEQTQIMPDVIYGHKNGMALVMHVYRPAAANGAGVVQIVSGGYFSNWEPANPKSHLVSRFLQSGYTVFSVFHGSNPKYTIPEIVEDMRLAVRFIRVHADDYGIDAKRIGAIGSSAGGHLALMLATTGDDGDKSADNAMARTSSRVAAVVAIAAPSDLRDFDKFTQELLKNGVINKAFSDLIKPAFNFDPKLADSMSPVLHVTPDDAATMLIHGDADQLVPIEFSQRILAPLREKGVPNELVVLPGVGHGPTGDQMRRLVESIDGAVDWFDKYLAAPQATTAELPRSNPEAQGVSSSDVLSFIEAIDNIDSMNSFMLVRHGRVVAEGWWSPYRAEARHSLYSLSKSFTSTAVGLAIAEGKLCLDDEVLKFFPNDVPPEPSNNLKAMRVSDLLRMSTGQQTEPPRTSEEPWTRTFLAHPVPFKPGTHFLYNTSATYMQSAIVQKATGQTVLDFLQSRLFEPLGIEGPTWETSPQGISTGGYGLSIRTEDIAKFGQLYLQKGKWHDKQLVPATWIEAATARQTSNGSNPDSDWDQGYGYQFWRCRNGAYRGDGAFGQYCIMLPEQDAVIAITSGVRDMRAVLSLIWEKLLPAMKSSALASDDEAGQKLQQKLNGLTLRLPESTSEPAESSGRTYVFPTNDSKLEAITLARDAADGHETLITRVDGLEQRIACGRGKWHEGQVAWGAMPRQPAATAGGWTNEAFTAKICFYETPFIVTIRLTFAGDELTVNSESNVGFRQTKQPELVGKAAEERKP
jgi:CubicO group peptidase (beta-lactamase class C family)/acetyl esterase/lipase